MLEENMRFYAKLYSDMHFKVATALVSIASTLENYKYNAKMLVG